MAWTLGRSLLSVSVQAPRRPYYRAIGRALAATARRRTPIPVEQFLESEVWVRYDGLGYLLTSDSSFGYYLHTFEPRTARDLLVRRGDVFLDIGANTGQYTVPLARRFRTVIAVEPNPIAARILRRNVERNHLGNVTVLERLVLPERGRGRLFKGEVLTTWGTVTEADEYVDVEAVTLDDLLGDRGQIDLVKLDIEGREADVLGSSENLGRVRTISFSGTPDDLARVRSHLEGFGFVLRRPSGVFRSIENFVAERPVGPTP
jgi:FkbM family methyltransferase